MYRRLQGDVRLALRRVMVLRCCIVVLRRVTVLRCCIVVLRRVMVLRCCIVVLRRVTVLRCILLLFLPFPVLLFLFSFPHLVLVPRYGEITMKAFRPSPFTGDMHTERRIFGIASRCGTFGTRHTEMVAFCAAGFSATAHNLHVLRASYPALFQVIPGGTSVGARGCIGRKRNSAIRTFAGQRIVRFVGRERSRFILHPAPFFQLFFQKKTGGPFSADVVGEIGFGFGHGSDSSCVSLCHDMFLEQITNKKKDCSKRVLSNLTSSPQPPANSE